MFRKVAVLVLLVVSFVMFSLSAAVLAEEEEQKSKEAQIGQLKERVRELENALEREDSEEKAAELKKALQEIRKKLDRLADRPRKVQKPRGEFPEIQQALRRTNGNLEELRQAVKILKEKDDEPQKLEELQQKIGQEEKKLVEYKELLRKRKEETRKKKPTPRTELKFFPLEHANAGGLSDIIRRFLAPSGIIAADPATSILIVKATPSDLEIASAIVKNLDIPRRRGDRDRPRRRREQREGAEREGDRDQPRRRWEQPEEAERGSVFFGKVLKAGEYSLTIETRDSKEKVTLYVPVRMRDDGLWVLNEKLSAHVSSFEAGDNVRVDWRQGDEKRFIVRVSKLEE